MNLLKLISTLQGIVIIVLCVAIFQLTGKVDLLYSQQSQSASLKLDQPKNNAAQVSVSNQQLRLLLREELLSIRDWPRTIDQPVPFTATDHVGETDSDQSAILAVDESIEYHISIGSISVQEMGNLQAEIARLDTSNRKAMLKKLVQAMNDGRLDGYL